MIGHHRACYLGPGPLHGKTALVRHDGIKPGTLRAQFDDLSLAKQERGPGLMPYCFGWHTFSARHWRAI